MASENDHYEIVKLLIFDPRYDLSSQDNYAFRSACEEGHLQIGKLLLADQRFDQSAHYNYAKRIIIMLFNGLLLTAILKLFNFIKRNIKIS